MAAYPIFYDPAETPPAIGDERSVRPAVYPLIGNTPLVELTRITRGLPAAVRVFAKAEGNNPGGSVKDRAALFMLRRALAESRTINGQRILDATSGNTGISLAMLGAALGVGITLCMPANATEERKKTLAAYGAEVILTDPLASTDGAQQVARELAAAHPERYYYLNQYANPANVAAHYETTGPEIWKQTRGEITHFIAGLGTSGTFTGVSRYLKKRLHADVQTWTFQPDGPLHGIEGIKHLPSVHVPDIFDATLVDGNLEVSTDAAYAMLKRLAREEGLLVGPSAAAAAVAALALAQTLDYGVVVTVFPDRADKYLSLPLWSQP